MPRIVTSVLIWLWLLAIPLAYNYWTLDPALYGKFLLLDISLAGLLLCLAQRGGGAIPEGTQRFFIPYIIYIALSAVSMSVYQTDLPDGIFVWLHLLTLPASVLALLAADRQSAISRQQVVAAIAVMATIACLIGAVQYYQAVSLNGWHLRAADAVRSVFANKNICAEVLLLTLPFSLYTLVSGGRWRVVGVLALTVTLVILAVTLSRAVWLAAIVAMVVTLCCYAWASGYWRPRWQHAAILVGTLVVAYIGFRWFLRHTNTGDYIADFYNKRDTIRERQHLWGATWQIFRDHFLLGTGTGSWRVMNMRYGIVGLRDYTTFFQQPHNDYLWVLSDQGILAFIAVGAAWLYIARTLLQKVLAHPLDLFLYCLIFALTGYAVYASFAFPRERAEHGILLAFILFFILREDSGTVAQLVVPRYLYVLLALLVLAGGWYAGHKMMAEVHLRRFFTARDIRDDMAQRQELAAIDQRYFLLDGTATPIAYYSGMLRFAQNDVMGAAADFDAAVQANPYHAYSLSNVATCYSIKGDKIMAERYFHEALTYAPGFPDAALNLCAIKYNVRQLDSAAYYLGMAEDTLTNPRYVKFISVVTGAVLADIRRSGEGRYDSIVTVRLSDIEKKPDWERDLLRKAYLHHRSLRLQILQDIAYVLRHQDQDTAAATRFENENNLKEQ